jgi:alanyl-tRNA synthetase
MNWTARKTRQTFLEFFKNKGHEIVPSAPMVIKNDPTLMFTNAGMNPFKDLFLGVAPVVYPRIADTQKCLRVSGKHNDLEEVGHDTYHHTMFEMLGNWSFGDYFKKEAIAWAWELLTEVYQLDKNRLYVTVFEGDANENLEPDNEASDYWKTWIAADRILKGNKKDNFWEMGDTGPCGPCSEIHIDLRPEQERRKINGASLVNEGHPQVVEIWNLVFMEFNRKADGSLEFLPAKHVDTGMGFERLCMALQGKTSNYDTDVFSPLIKKISQLTNTPYGQNEKTDIAIRVISDHIRAVSFAIADGQLPSNTGAGYVIRRILRRAVRYGFTYLDAKTPMMNHLVAVLATEMGDAFPEIAAQADWIQKIIAEEEQSFLRTLEQGLIRLDAMIDQMTDMTLDGKRAFELYDTFGFPPDLTMLILNERNLKMDKAGFDSEMEQQKQRSKAATQIKAGDWVVISKGGGRSFLGHDQTTTASKIVRYRLAEAGKKTFYQIVLDQTTFYPEGGGQVGDRGWLISPHDRLEVLDTKKENGLIIHNCDKLPENPQAQFEAVVDSTIRSKTAANHSATHLLHEALREVLGTHVSQKGSLLNDQYLRFDFAHISKVTSSEMEAIEALVNERIIANLPLQEYREIPLQEAEEMGAMMLFGEKYGAVVRAIQFGKSIELCGGTHVRRTGDIGLFKITAEGAVAAGIRRIEAVTGLTAMKWMDGQLQELREIKALMKAPQPLAAIEKLKAEVTILQKKIGQLQQAQAEQLADKLLMESDVYSGIRYIGKTVDLDTNAIKDLCFSLKSQNHLIAMLGNRDGEKVTLSLLISDDLVAEKGLNAGQMIRELAKEIRGGGGGQAFFATAGGSDASGLDRAYQALQKKIVDGF